MPTPTITEASEASARIRRRPRRSRPSPAAGRTPSRSSCSVVARSAPRSTRTTTSRAARSVLAEGWSPSSARLFISTMSGRKSASRSASAPRSTPIRTGCCSFRNGRMAASSAAYSWPRTTTTTGRPAIRVAGAGRRPWRSRSCSRRRNSVLLWVNVSSWLTRPLRAPAISARTVSASTSRPEATASSSTYSVPSCSRTLELVLDGGQPGRADRVDEGDAGVGQHLRAQVGVAAGDHRSGVDDGGDTGVDEGLRGGAVHVEVVEDGEVARSQPRQQDARAAFDAGGADQSGRGDSALSSSRLASGSSCQPVRGVPRRRGRARRPPTCRLFTRAASRRVNKRQVSRARAGWATSSSSRAWRGRCRSR